MKKFTKRYLFLIFILIITICLTSTLVACNKRTNNEELGNEETEGAKGDSNTMIFNPIEVTDSTEWAENTDYKVVPVEYSDATIAKFAEIINNGVSYYDLLDMPNVHSDYTVLNVSEKKRYKALFAPGETSEYDSFGDYRTYYDEDEEERAICIVFTFSTTKYDFYYNKKTQEDMTAAQNFFDSLEDNPATANGEELNLSFKYENTVFVGNEKGFGYLHQDYVDASSRLVADKEWAESVNNWVGLVSRAGVAEAKINAVLDTIITANQANDVIKTRAQLLADANEEKNGRIEKFRNILDSIILNISIDQIGLFGYNYIVLTYQRDIEYYREKLEGLDSEDKYYQEDLERYEGLKEEAINSKSTIENIPQSQFLVFSRILISMFKSGIQLTSMDETKELYSFFFSGGDLLLKDAAKTLAKEIGALNIGQETMSLLISTIADMRIGDYFFTGKIDNITMNNNTEDEEQQEHNKYSKAYDNGVHDALYQIKDDFSAILSIISKACNSINNTDMTNYTKKSGVYTIGEGDGTKYYVERQQVTQETYNQTMIENDKYTIKLLVSALSDFTDSDYELLFSNFNAAVAALNDAFVEQGFEADAYEGTVPTQQELITAMKTLGATKDEDIQNIESSEVSENVDNVLNKLMAYFISKTMNMPL